MSATPDPGKVFDSNAHRRVLGHLPLSDEDPISVEALVVRIAPDEWTPSDEDELLEVVKDLEADGYAVNRKDGWKQTSKGLAALNAPVPEEG